MRNQPFFFMAIALAALLSACGETSPLFPEATLVGTGLSLGARSVPGRVLVKWRDPAAAQAVYRQLGLRPPETLEGLGVDVVSLKDGLTPGAFVAAAGPALDYAEPDFIARPDLTPNDPDYSKQYALRKVRAPQAWDKQQGSPDVRIAIIDTGCDLNHPDLKSQIVASDNTIHAGASARDDNGHGTHCAGIAAASINNGAGIAGIAPGCKLLVVKALGADGSGAVSSIARGIDWAITQHASVISLSMGSPDDSRSLRASIARAEGAGIVVVAAMGNDGKTVKSYPACYPGVIAVGATTESDRVANYSTRGNWISVAAPGSDILSTTPTYPVFLNDPQQDGLKSTYGVLSGTSMATPLVAGLAALIKSSHTDWTPAQVKTDLEATAHSIGGSFNPDSGHGRVDAASALGIAP